MGDIDSINAILASDVRIPVNTYEYGTVILEESDSSAKLTQVAMRGFDGDRTIAFKLDIPQKRISEYLNASTGKINKACDGIIFTYLEDAWHVFICEMKSGRPNEQECILKYRNSTLFVKYIHSILKEFFSFEHEFRIKYILFDVKKKMSKTSSKGRKVEINKLVDGENNKPLYIYNVHHLGRNEFFNIRHLNL
ncbi:MAG: hypothetical protein GY862_36575 [Gammaproteobacteria bacterium]|nr:hypothetical protein [Gammaproteobacteria bacterium]